MSQCCNQAAQEHIKREDLLSLYAPVASRASLYSAIEGRSRKCGGGVGPMMAREANAPGLRR